MPFYFRINRIKILDNRENGFLFFKKDRATIKFTSIVTTEDEKLPQIDAYRKIRNKNLQNDKDLTEALVKHVLNKQLSLTIDSIKDNQIITFGDTGLAVYRSETMPVDLSWFLLAMEDDSPLRQIGNNITSNENFDSLTSHISSLIQKSIPNPVFNISLAVIKFIINSLAKSMRQNKDDMVGLLCMSLNRHEHYPHGERKSDNVPDLTGNMLIDYSVFGFEDVPPRACPRRLP